MRRSAVAVLAHVRLLRGVMFRMNTRLPTAVADTRLCGFTCLQQHDAASSWIQCGSQAGDSSMIQTYTCLVYRPAPAVVLLLC
jgi:hypothetical protein